MSQTTRALFATRSGRLPDAAAWAGINGIGERLAAGLTAVYSWYERHPSLTACVMRDVEHHATTQEVMKRRVGPIITAWHEVLGEKLSARQGAMLHLALDFYIWRSLVRVSGLKQAAAVEAMVRAIESADKA